MNLRFNGVPFAMISRVGLAAGFSNGLDVDLVQTGSGAEFEHNLHPAGIGSALPGGREVMAPNGIDGNVLLTILRCRHPVTLHLGGAPNPLRSRDRFIVRRADVIVVRDEDVALAAIQAGASPKRIRLLRAWDLGPFSKVELFRSGDEAHRFIFVGDLCPLAGSLDFQYCAATWAAKHPNSEIDVTWIGQGDLRAVLDAQPLPLNMKQRFMGPVRGAALADVFGECGLLVVPEWAAGVGNGGNAPVREACVAGLPVLGSRRNRLVTSLVLPGETGWLFDPMEPRSMTDALESAMSLSVDRLNEMRVAARARALAPTLGLQALAPFSPPVAAE